MDENNKKILSCVIPCFNEENVLENFIEVLNKALHSILLNGSQISYEIILINDGSSDSTLEILKKASVEYENVSYISLSRNFGKEAALYAGLSNVSSEYVVIMDADFQDPPELIREMFSIMQKKLEYDCVTAYRTDRKGESFIRSLFSEAFYKLMNHSSSSKMKPGTRDFRMMRKRMVDAVLSLSERNRFSKGIFSWVGFRTYWIPYKNVERQAGTSGWSFWSLLRYAISGICNFSTVPLGIISTIGVGVTLLSVIGLIVFVIRKLTGASAAYGWTSMVCIILFLGGIQILSLGIIGQYIARLYEEVKGRPHYIADESSREMKMVG